MTSVSVPGSGAGSVVVPVSVPVSPRKADEADEADGGSDHAGEGWWVCSLLWCACSPGCSVYEGWVLAVVSRANQVPMIEGGEDGWLLGSLVEDSLESRFSSEDEDGWLAHCLMMMP